MLTKQNRQAGEAGARPGAANCPRTQAPPLRLMLDISAWQSETQGMSAADRGALLALKMFFWHQGKIPDNDQILAQIAGLDLRGWKRVRQVLERKFIVKYGEWQREDWSNELDAAYEAVRKAKVKSQKGHDARWRRNATGNASGNATGNASGVLNIYSSTAQPKYKAKTPTPPSQRRNSVQPDFEADVATAERNLKTGGAL